MEQRRGFTLIELIVVLAVIGILTAILAPVITRYVDDARKSTAEKNVKILATAITAFFKDTGIYPGWRNGNSTGGNQSVFTILISSTTADTPTTGFAGSNANDWIKNGTVGNNDTLANHLQKNNPTENSVINPGFRTTGRFAWQGPYQQEYNDDPWGTYYAFNSKLIQEQFKTKAVFLISAGPDKQMDTEFSVISKDLVFREDDIGFQIR